MIAKITDAYVRRYSDSGQVTAYVEWIDDHGKTGCTEGQAWLGIPGIRVSSLHLAALIIRAEHEGITIRRETW